MTQHERKLYTEIANLKQSIMDSQEYNKKLYELLSQILKVLLLLNARQV